MPRPEKSGREGKHVVFHVGVRLALPSHRRFSHVVAVSSIICAAKASQLVRKLFGIEED